MDDAVCMFKYMMVKILQHMLVACVQVKDYFSKLFSARVPDNIKIAKHYSGQPILLFAMYEPNHVRPDVKRFLKIARKVGLYVVGVNTAVITEKVDDLFDCYIERENIGRDFGSYKAGFEYIDVKGYTSQCPRLLMMNDSVFYESSRAEKFIQLMINTEKQVLGATENFEIHHHLGSFCISIAHSIFQADKFKAFWTNYKNSDVRLVVIEEGEAALSACLRQCVSTPDEMGAFYNMLFIDKVLREDPYAVSEAFRLARKGVFPGWPNLKPSASSDPLYLVGQVLDVFRVGSQIHQNNALLIYLGLPIVKIDGVYRGMFIEEDVDTMASLMSSQEGIELKSLLMSKPFWGDKVKDARKWLYLLGIK